MAKSAVTRQSLILWEETVTRFQRLIETAALFLITALFATVALAAPQQGPTVTTTEGSVRGLTQDGVSRFLGIPYAAPPVGDLRWMPPVQPAKYDMLNATHFANSCPQVTTLGPFAGPTSITEDCLYLNVYTPDISSSKPVIVWIHGGGYVTGAASDYDGSMLATGGPDGTPTVVVTINYRLGLLGFLSEPHLNAEGHHWGNYGILDVQAALRWVQDNIAAFGGDPKRVTLGGQSAGSSAAAANQVSPLAKGLFNRVINQSPPISTFALADKALENGTAFAEAAGCSDAACLRSLSAARILQLQGTPNANGIFVTGVFADGTIIPRQPIEAWRSGKYNHMPIMGGATKEESTFGESIREYFSGPPQAPLSAQDYKDRVELSYTEPLYVEDASAQVLKTYPAGSNPQATYERAFTDPGKCRGLDVLKAQAASNGKYPVYGYDFIYQNAPYYFPKMPNPENPSGNFMAKASHTSDIQFLFKNWHGGNLGVNIDQETGLPRELEGDEVTLSNQLVAAWTNFAATGDPNGQGVPEWPALTKAKAQFLVQDVPMSVEDEAEFRAAYQCDFWAPFIRPPAKVA